MLKNMINSFTGGFMRTFGQYFFYFLLGFLSYFLIKELNIDWKWLVQ